MPVPASIDDLSTTASSNSPAGSETPTEGDNYIRTAFSFIASLRDKLNGAASTGTLTTPVFVGTPTGTVTAGTYTPTLTTISNISSLTALKCQYMRVGPVVTVSGALTFTITTNGNATEIGMTLPIASDFTAVQDLGGVAALGTTAPVTPLQILADVTNNRARFIAQPASTAGTSNTWSFTFSYEVK